MIINPSPESAGKGGLAFLSNYKMNIYKDNAWVSHEEVSVGVDGKESHSRELRMLEKAGSLWKLVGQSMYIYNLRENNTDTISYLNVVDIATNRIESVYKTNKLIEAPNWHVDNYLIVNSYGRLYTFDLKTKEYKVINSGKVNAVNNDHGLSPDNKWLVVSNNENHGTEVKTYNSTIRILPITGGESKKITSEQMSFWHGWSPDGKTMAFTGFRDGDFDIYTVGINGGPQTRLTNSIGLDDGPDYSKDGKYIYFNSYRTGHMQIWRMLADGSNPEQLTFDEHSNWFAHPSPDNKWIVYIAYINDEKQNHLFGKSVKLRLMNLETKEIKDLTPVFFGGQGTINVPSWSPDSKKIAFVSYSVK
jgi:Tol biopolymer transport system component